MKDLLLEKLDILKTATLAREKLEVEYSLEEARMIHSAEVNEFSNQKQRDARVRILMEKNGKYREMAYARADAKIAYYEWASIKSLVDRKFKND